MRSLEGKNVLVSGGAGFIGSHLVERVLDEAPSRVVVVDNLALGKRENLTAAQERRPDTVFHGADAGEQGEMRQILERYDIDVVFNLAVVPLPASFDRPRWTVQTNEEIGITLLELLRKGYYDSLVHFSSSEAYGTAVEVPMTEDHPMRPSTPYAASKAASDHLVHSYVETFGVDATILRPFNTYGPRQNERQYAGIIPIVIRRVIAGEPIEIYGDGEQTRDYLFVRDTADAAVRLYAADTAKGEAINVASTTEYTINDVVKTILRVMEVPDHPVFHVRPRPGDVRRLIGSHERAKKLIGFRPTVAFEEGLAQTVAWYRQRGRPGELAV